MFHNRLSVVIEDRKKLVYFQKTNVNLKIAASAKMVSNENSNTIVELLLL